MSRGVRGYHYEEEGPTSMSVREKPRYYYPALTGLYIRDCSPTRARVPSFSLLSPDECKRRDEAATCTNTKSRQNSQRTQTHRPGRLLTVDSIAGGVLMEAEICDLDELTGSALGDQPPISNCLLSLSLSLSDPSSYLGREALF